MAGRNEPLVLDVEHKKLVGVCAGIADYFDVDVTLVRAVTASLILLGPGVVVLYAILWWALDEAPTATEPLRADEIRVADEAVFAPPAATPVETPAVLDLSATDKADVPPGT